MDPDAAVTADEKAERMKARQDAAFGELCYRLRLAPAQLAGLPPADLARHFAAHTGKAAPPVAPLAAAVVDYARRHS